LQGEIYEQSPLFEEMATAAEWGVSPEEYFSWSREARTFAMAFLRVKSALVNVLSEAARKKAEREARVKHGR